MTISVTSWAATHLVRSRTLADRSRPLKSPRRRQRPYPMIQVGAFDAMGSERETGGATAVLWGRGR